MLRPLPIQMRSFYANARQTPPSLSASSLSSLRTTGPNKNKKYNSLIRTTTRTTPPLQLQLHTIANSNTHYNTSQKALHQLVTSSLAPTTTTTTTRLFTSSSSSTTSSSLVEQQSSFSKSNQEYLEELMPTHDANGRKYTLYEKCVRRLYLTNLFHPVKMGLLNMERLHEALGNPMNSPDITIIHVAGTNGKGSVALKTAKSLQLAGHKVGLFVSPHIASFRERMQINNELISQEQVEEYLPQIYTICEENEIPATFFEITTALAFQYFAKNNVDVVVLETGLGGRLDATNVITQPDLCVITSIGLEHTRILGDTVEEIAGEKAGIIKKGSPVLVGPNVPEDVIRNHAKEKGAEGYYTIEDVMMTDDNNNNNNNNNDDDGKTTTKTTMNNKVILNGVEYVDYDIENTRIATSALHLLQQKQGSNSKLKPILEEHILEGTSHRPPCRFETMIYTSPNDPNQQTTTVILDVAHNPPAMDLLVGKLKATYPNTKKRIVVGFSRDKDLSKCGQSLLTLIENEDASSLHIVEAAHPRAATIEAILEAEPKLKQSNFDEKDRSISGQVRAAIKIAQEKDEMLVVCGSVFLMSEAREALGIDEPRDSKYIAEVAGSGLRSGQENFGDKDPEGQEAVAT